MGTSYYALLDVSPDASEEEIREAFRARIKEVHPDTGSEEASEEHTKRLIKAKEVLLDPEQRQRYDAIGHDVYTGESTFESGISASPGQTSWQASTASEDGWRMYTGVEPDRPDGFKPGWNPVGHDQYREPISSLRTLIWLVVYPVKLLSGGLIAFLLRPRNVALIATALLFAIVILPLRFLTSRAGLIITGVLAVPILLISALGHTLRDSF